MLCKTCDGIVVGAVDVFAGAVEVNGVGDEQDRAVLVVVNGHVGDHVERELGQLHVVGGRVGRFSQWRTTSQPR